MLALMLYSSSIHMVMGQEKRSTTAFRTQETMEIDGLLQEPAWQLATSVVEFTELMPNPGKIADNQARVRVLYDDTGIYFSAELDESHMEGLGNELFQRDDLNDNRKIDWFAVVIDPYLGGINGYAFVVSASGVQTDLKFISDDDDTSWDAVWDSDIRINEHGWTCEIKIPYSALRFPEKDVQKWGINFGRKSYQRQDESWWNPVSPEIDGLIPQVGILEGLSNIKPPLRLALTPYFALYAEKVHDPKQSSPKTGWTNSYNGGMDVKYGISEAYTLDMTLIPDFGQVQSDNQVLNLSPFEVQFDENRQFFTEGTELFNKANVFYSRRIGGTPYYFDHVFQQIGPDEFVEDINGESRLINATKISGRSAGGTGLGFFNAVSPRDHATIRNHVTGESHQVVSQPWTNYNMVVVDQSLKNNSYITLINTNVTREGIAHDANVTGLEFDLRDKENKYGIGGGGAVSHKNNFIENNNGFRYNLYVARHSGNFNWDVGYSVESDTYDPNDLGFIYNNNESSLEMSAEYRQFKPFGPFLDAGAGFNARRSALYKYPGAPENQVRQNLYTDGGFEICVYAKFKNFMNLNAWMYTQPVASYDYFEPRVPGRFFIYPAFNNVGINFNSDARKRWILSLHSRFNKFHEKDKYRFVANGSLSYRINNHFTAYYELEKQFYTLDRGYVNEIGSDIVFGARDYRDVTQNFDLRYSFNPKTTLSFRLRHNWTRVHYTHFYTLESDGDITPRDYQEDEDLNFNAWTIDTAFRWRFAPGSDIFVVWKNSIFGLDQNSQISFSENLDTLFDHPQTNSFSVKAIYYLDMQKLK